MPPHFPPAWRLGKDNKGVSRTMAVCAAEPAPAESWEPQGIDPSPPLAWRPGGHASSLVDQAALVAICASQLVTLPLFFLKCYSSSKGA